MDNKYPVAFFVFKRPEHTKKFLEIMAVSGIRKVYVYGDGPRTQSDKILVDRVKQSISDFADLHPDIEIISMFSAVNLGLKRSIISGLNTVFQKEKAAVILEDDCLPTADFFRFTSEMLTRYADNPQIMSVNGSSTGGSYHFSYDFTKYSQCWGWATWARAWKLYDSELSKYSPKSWHEISNKLGFGRLMSWYWRTMLTVVRAGQIDTWDFQWSFAHFLNHGLAISPSVNMIKNIGFDAAATNTKTKTAVSDLYTAPLAFPLKHPAEIIENLSVSCGIESKFYRNPIAILGLIRQYFYWKVKQYAARS